MFTNIAVPFNVPFADPVLVHVRVNVVVLTALTTAVAKSETLSSDLIQYDEELAVVVAFELSQ